MKSNLLITLLFVAICIGFNCTSDQSNSIFSRQNIPVTVITINPERDTLVQTPQGALLKIPAGAITNKNSKEVKLELIEVYTMMDIIKAGLYTQSNGDPLSSGGMIYINAAAGQQVTIKQKIQIAIPADYANSKMKLYKGEEQQDGSVNWNNPTSLPENKQAESYDRGRIFFEEKCATCHRVGKALTGPDLAHFSKRFSLTDEGDLNYYYHLLQKPDTASDRNFEHMDYNVHAYEIYKCNLARSGGWTYGPQFSDLKGEDCLDIFRYIQNESDRNQLALPPQAPLRTCADSCEAYLSKGGELTKLKNKTEAERRKYIADNGEMTEVTNLSPGNTNATNLTINNFNEFVSPENLSATYYQFSIDSFGWYNIDILLKDVDGVKESTLLVNISGEWRQRVDLYLIIPEAKVFVEGGKTGAVPDEYAFLYKNGKINLPQNAKAYVLAMSEQKETIAFSLREFTTTTQQRLDISLTQTTKDLFESALSIFQNENLKIGASQTKHAQDIRIADEKIETIDKQIKALETEKPVNCDCNCGLF